MTTPEQALFARLNEIFGLSFVNIAPPEDKSSDCGVDNLFFKTARAKPFCMVRPTENYNNQLEKLVKLARKFNKKILVRGGGSGVCGALKVRGEEIIVDTSALNKIVLIRELTDECEGLVLAEAGVYGNKLDEFLKQKGFTHGHYPASLAVSTVGGWVSTKSNGHFSLYYGNIENLVVAVEGINGKGEVVRLEGGDLKKVFRMEGTTMIVTRVWLKVFKVPVNDHFLTFSFDYIGEMIGFLKKMPGLRDELKQHGVQLYTVRAYDFVDYKFMSKPHKGDSHRPQWLKKISYFVEKQLCRASRTVGNMVRMLERQGKAPWTVVVYMSSDSPEALPQAAEMLKNEAQIHNGIDLGPTVAHSWHIYRLKLGYDKVIERFNAGITVDTFETTMEWERLIEAYGKIRKVIFGFGLVGVHIGIDLDRPYLYFIFGIAGRNREGHKKAVDEILYTCIESGIPTTHHHGIGKLKAGRANVLVPYAYGWNWYYNVALPAKHEMDPYNILNPKNIF